MFAILKTGGKQYKVREGDVIEIEKLDATTDERVEFDRVLALFEEGELQAGAPYLEDVAVRGRVVEQGRGDKITVFKFKPKIRYRKEVGHRQPYTQVLIEKIEA